MYEESVRVTEPNVYKSVRMDEYDNKESVRINKSDGEYFLTHWYSWEDTEMISDENIQSPSWIKKLKDGTAFVNGVVFNEDEQCYTISDGCFEQFDALMYESERDDISEVKETSFLDYVPNQENSIGSIEECSMIDGLEEYNCDVCKCMFTALAERDSHLTIKHGIKKYCCKICKKRFTLLGNSMRHVRICKKNLKALSKDTINAPSKVTINGPSKDIIKAPLKDIIKAPSRLKLQRPTDSIKESSMIDGIEMKSKEYNCDVCKCKFTVLAKRDHHLTIEHGMKKYSCKLCQKRFTQRSYSLMHAKICKKNPKHQKPADFIKESSLIDGLEMKSKEYNCDVCKCMFTVLAKRDCHLTIEHGIKKYSCKLCQKRFTQRGYSLKHAKTCKKIPKDQKPADFIKESSMIDGLEMKSKEYNCDVCKCTFTVLAKRDHHLTNKHGMKKYSCKLCQKRFTHLCNSTRHVMMCKKNPQTEYKDEYPKYKGFECKICGWKFRRIRECESHMYKKHRITKYSCTVCCKNFANRDTLTTHTKSSICKRTVHNIKESKLSDIYEASFEDGSKTYNCDVCGSKFQYLHNFESHLYIKHGIKNFSLDPICKEKVPNLDGLYTDNTQEAWTVHDLGASSKFFTVQPTTTMYSCHKCPQEYKSKDNLQQHLKKHEGIKFSCTYCKKEFTRSDHVSRHQRNSCTKKS